MALNTCTVPTNVSKLSEWFFRCIHFIFMGPANNFLFQPRSGRTQEHREKSLGAWMYTYTSNSCSYTDEERNKYASASKIVELNVYYMCVYIWMSCVDCRCSNVYMFICRSCAARSCSLHISAILTHTYISMPHLCAHIILDVPNCIILLIICK